MAQGENIADNGGLSILSSIHALIVTELPIIERTFDLIKWYIPILNRLPKDHKYLLGNRIAVNLYDLLDGLILARYASNFGWIECESRYLYSINPTRL